MFDFQTSYPEMQLLQVTWDQGQGILSWRPQQLTDAPPPDFRDATMCIRRARRGTGWAAGRQGGRGLKGKGRGEGRGTKRWQSGRQAVRRAGGRACWRCLRCQRSLSPGFEARARVLTLTNMNFCCQNVTDDVTIISHDLGHDFTEY